MIKLFEELGREPMIEEIAAEGDIDVERATKLLICALGPK